MTHVKKNFVSQYRPQNHLTKSYLCNFVNEFQKIVSISLGGEIPREWGITIIFDVYVFT